MSELKGWIFTKENCFRPGRIVFDGEWIQEIRLCAASELTEAEREQLLLPGLVDVHFHGAAGYDFCDGTKEAHFAIEAYENQNGITSICPATMTLPIGELERILIQASSEKPDSLIGIHLEGPFISKEKKGAQKADYIIPPKAEILRRLQESAGGLVKLVSIAPEVTGALSCIEKLRNEFCFSIAHTTADYKTAAAAIRAGARHITHLYNAMKTPTHREPAVVGAAAEDSTVMAELICDGIHVHPCTVRNTFRLFGADRIVLISDSMMATGMKDGQYMLGGQDVTVKGALATLADGTIAGSATNLYQCMKKAVEMGISREAAIQAATINPARSIGMEGQVGSLEAGKYADIVVASQTLSLKQVILKGKMIKSA